MVINIDYLKTRGNNLKSLASIFQVAIHFHYGHLQPKTLKTKDTNITIGNSNRLLFLGFLWHKCIFWLFKEMLKIHDRASLISTTLVLTSSAQDIPCDKGYVVTSQQMLQHLL